MRRTNLKDLCPRHTDRQFAEVFDRAMSELSTMILKKVLEVYKGFKDVNFLVDVGGWILLDWMDELCIKLLKNYWKGKWKNDHCRFDYTNITKEGHVDAVERCA
ncbi:hypothetical protein HID58_056028 [Brassica napus]|uniref:O-methyltransferase C-terminal domain-containing protein n=1 Tax=Brassica napus TaxID=3708 RepID=A0ABQ8AM14_BRANA|nr:hypothetical protein HID58_056028 [Brassica napus]